MYISSSDSSLNANHKSNCLFDTSTWISNRHLKFIMSETELLIFFPKLSHPMVSPISVNGNSLLHLLRPKALESSSVPISYTSRLVYQQILQTWSYILYWIQPLFATFAAIILVDRNSLLAGLPAAPSSPTSALLHAAKSFGSSCFTQEKKKKKTKFLFHPSHSCLLTLLQPLCCSWNRPGPQASALGPVHWLFHLTSPCMAHLLTSFKYLLESHLAHI